MIILDYIASIVQAIVFNKIVQFCVGDSKKNNFRNICATVFMFLVCSPLLTGTYGETKSFSTLIIHILLTVIVLVFYNEKKVYSITAFTMVYYIILISSAIFGNVIFEFFRHIIDARYINYAVIGIVYIPGIIALLLCVRYKESIRRFCHILVKEEFWFSAIITSFFLDFIVMFYLMVLGGKSQVIKNITYILFFLAFAGMTVYLISIHNKAKRIFELNEALETKNNELRKIKHDYGAQISYLYGLHLMKRFDDLGNALKGIINTNQNTPSAVEINKNDSVIFSMALKPAIEKGIHVIIEDQADLSLISIDEMELYRIVSNIINNAIRAMEGTGIIIAKAYNTDNSIHIKLENNGPKIEDNIVNKIFESGFTTKKDNDKNHGYGLSIVRELVEKYKGKISVKSTIDSTVFSIEFPIK